MKRLRFGEAVRRAGGSRKKKYKQQQRKKSHHKEVQDTRRGLVALTKQSGGVVWKLRLRCFK
jgi:hypothetical protein